MITKADALTKLNTQDEADYKNLTAKVEAALKTFNNKPVTVDCGGLSQKAIDRVTAEYSTAPAGWTVVLGPAITGAKMETEGPWLTFS